MQKISIITLDYRYFLNGNNHKGKEMFSFMGDILLFSLFNCLLSFFISMFVNKYICFLPVTDSSYKFISMFLNFMYLFFKLSGIMLILQNIVQYLSLSTHSVQLLICNINLLLLIAMRYVLIISFYCKF